MSCLHLRIAHPVHSNGSVLMLPSVQGTGSASTSGRARGWRGRGSGGWPRCSLSWSGSSLTIDRPAKSRLAFGGGFRGFV